MLHVRIPFVIPTLALGLSLAALAQTAPTAAPGTYMPAVGETQVAVPGAMEAVVAPVADEVAHDGLAPVGVFHARFDKDLFQTDPLMMYGIKAERYIPFHIPRSWTVTGDVELELRVDHSETLLPQNSALTVFVNNRAVASSFLNGENAKDGRILATVPSTLLGEFNQIRISVVQHYTTDCEDPFDPNLWTRISHESVLRIPYARKPVELDLVQLPGPLFEETGVGPVVLDLVTGTAPTAETMEAIGVLGFAYGRLADYRGLQIDKATTSLTSLRRHALVVGRWDEIAQVHPLLPGKQPAAGQGLVALVPNPQDPTLALLVVTGGDAEGLKKAAFAVAGNDRHEVLSGPDALINELNVAWPVSRRDPKPVPSTTRFTLADLNIQDRTVRGFYADPVVVPLQMEGDAAVRPSGAELVVDYSYSSQLDTRLSTLEVSVDGVVLLGHPLERPTGEQNGEIRVQIPPELLRPHAKVFLQYHLFPESFDACERVSDQIVWGTIHATTRFEVPRDHHAELPDLGRLRYDFWPYTLDGDAGAVTLITPDAPAVEDAAAAFLTSGLLGWHRATDDPKLTIASAAQLGNQLPVTHLILLTAGDSPNSTYQSLESNGYLRYRVGADGQRTLSGADGGVAQTASLETFGSVEQALLPTSKADRAMLVLRGNNRSTLLDMIEQLGAEKNLLKLSGNITVVPMIPTAEYRAVDNAERRPVGDRPLNTRVTVALGRYWPFFGLLLLSSALFFALTVSLWARRQGAHT